MITSLPLPESCTSSLYLHDRILHKLRSVTYCSVHENLPLYKSKWEGGGGGGGGGGRVGGVTLLVRNQILNMVKIVEHVDFQRRIEKSLHKFYRFVDF